MTESQTTRRGFLQGAGATFVPLQQGWFDGLDDDGDGDVLDDLLGLNEQRPGGIFVGPAENRHDNPPPGENVAYFALNTGEWYRAKPSDEGWEFITHTGPQPELEKLTVTGDTTIDGPLTVNDSLETDTVTINEYSAKLRLGDGNNFGINADTDTTIPYGNVNLDSAAFSWDSSTSVLTVEKAGDYRFTTTTHYKNFTDGVKLWSVRLYKNGSFDTQIQIQPGGGDANQGINGTFLQKDVASGTTFRFDARATQSCDVTGGSGKTVASVTREA